MLEFPSYADLAQYSALLEMEKVVGPEQMRPFVKYELDREAVGEAVVIRALAACLKQYAFKEPPYPNTLDFLTLLRAEARLQYDALITDLFEKITLQDNVHNAMANRRAYGKFELSFEVEGMPNLHWSLKRHDSAELGRLQSRSACK